MQVCRKGCGMSGCCLSGLGSKRSAQVYQHYLVGKRYFFILLLPFSFFKIKSLMLLIFNLVSGCVSFLSEISWRLSDDTILLHIYWDVKFKYLRTTCVSVK